MIFETTFRNLRRMREIVSILMKYGFEEIVVETPLFNFVPNATKLKWTREGTPIFEYSRWERIRMATEELGATFIKLAQILSNRPDLLPEPLIHELEKLQSNVPPFEFQFVRSIIKSELGKDIEDLFDTFDETPVGSASIGQVHRATLKDGSPVVVKIQRPQVKNEIQTDLSIIRYLVDKGEDYLKENGIINAMDVVNAFEKSMTKELDYRHEARNIENFRNFYKSYKSFYVPPAYKEMTTERVMVIEYVDGCKITNVKQLRAWGLSPKKISEVGMNVYLTQIFEFGYFHADPHPGNILIKEDGTVCLIDFGMVGKLLRRDKYAFASIFISMVNGDAKGAARSLRKLAVEDEINDVRQFEYEIAEIIDDFGNQDVSESNIAEMTNRLQKLMFDYKLRVPGSVYLIFRSLAILEGIGKIINPHFQTEEFVKPFGKKIIEERFNPKNIAIDFSNNVEELSSILADMPVEIKSILKQTRKGRLTFKMEHTGYEKLVNKMDRAINRLALAFLICAVLITSALTLNVNEGLVGSKFLGLPLISGVGFLLAGLLGLVLLYNVLKSRRF